MSTVAHNVLTDQVSDSLYLLDLFSISQSLPQKCIHHAPYICVPPRDGKDGYLCQTCCNDWLCPKCGQLRARHEYGRMVVGARELGKDHLLYMLTLTLTGTISLEDGEKTYLEKTNRLHTLTLTRFDLTLNRTAQGVSIPNDWPPSVRFRQSPALLMVGRQKTV